MESLLELLEERNFHLRKFKELNNNEMDNFCNGNFSNLETFYQTREGLLDVIRCIDEMINEGQGEVEGPGPADSQTRSQVQKALNEKTELITNILSQDLQILSFVENAKSEMIRELSSVKMARKAVGAYKSRGR